ncbi:MULTISPECIES: transcriptional regulator [Actinomyces]|uniref:Winged helix DNA-binding domain-containing protein n=1 Tax=Actinomyces respiraculi TaxID=2744574 RepID=A0A7T0LL60_9ACTO|nr:MULTISPECIES: transcriptional regulator [Actinomyces]QPL05368.1 hypothetical protein ID810_11805 [Actinomyces respiraculi]
MHGFSRRLTQTMVAWGLLWAAAVAGGTTVWAGEAWFAVVSVIALTKGYVGKRPRTRMLLTPEGRQQWGAHLEALRTIAGD